VPTNAVRVTGEGMIDVSGASLIMQNKPASKMRSKRADVNRADMDNWFKIEVGVARIARGDVNYGAGIRQEWIVNEMPFPKTDLEKMEEYAYRKDTLKVVDQKDAVVEFVPGVETREQADKYLLERPQAPAARPNLEALRNAQTVR
jgi:hypothetical protein